MEIKSKSLYLLIAISIVMVVVSAIITYDSSRKNKQATETLVRRYKSIESSIQLLSLIKDMETGQRGYVVTKDSEFLEPYYEAKLILNAQEDTLNSLINDHEQQANLLKREIIKAINKKTFDLENSIRIVNTFGRDSAAKRVDKKVGKAYMDTVRFLIHDLVKREREFLLEQNEALSKSAKKDDIIRFFAYALIGLTSLVALIALVKQQGSIKLLIGRLTKSKEELETKVMDRTYKLLEANQAKDHFLSMASHDLKVPIAGVLGIVEIMNLENKNRPESEDEYLNYIKDSCRNMQRLIGNLLDINRIEAGAATIKKQEVKLGKVLLKLQTDFSHQTKKKTIELVVNTIDVLIQTDQDALSRILENLLSNAIKFSPPNRRVELRTSALNGSIKFEIIDNGPGIPAEDIPKLFGKFQKLSNKPTGGEGSSGLGLSIVKELTVLLGGTISLTSNLAEGTTFTVIIPA